ncbi:DUF2177 family protein [Methylotenera sp.]|uniref:DUF2177 family protein n=1 Tax=Methylotenera sp. TaxID=2051956 RepID=UPI0024886338|nr:DUF2177 family protein [Methylotenera sp.]MDI1298530.1 DUF2177 family protein [Methylotenera sp.]
MIKLLPAYITIIVVMFVLDLVWLSMLAEPLYQAGIGHLMAAKPNLMFAGLFYLVYALGLMRFAILPNIAARGIKNTFVAAAVFGFFIYASYDLTNLALLKDWPLRLSVIDIAWGTLLSGVSASVGKLVFNKMSKSK